MIQTKLFSELYLRGKNGFERFKIFAGKKGNFVEMSK